MQICAQSAAALKVVVLLFGRFQAVQPLFQRLRQVFRHLQVVAVFQVYAAGQVKRLAGAPIAAAAYPVPGLAFPFFSLRLSVLVHLQQVCDQFYFGEWHGHGELVQMQGGTEKDIENAVVFRFCVFSGIAAHGQQSLGHFGLQRQAARRLPAAPAPIFVVRKNPGAQISRSL